MMKSIEAREINKPNSSEYNNYLCEYRYGSKNWTIEISATSRSDAAARLKAISEGNVLGPIYAKIPARFGWFAKLLVSLRNQFS